MYPVFGHLTRRCTREICFYNYNNEKCKIEKNSIVIIPIFSIHRDATIYSDPEKFDPNRFSWQNGGVKKYRDLGAFLAFSDGPRQCLGLQTLVLIVEVF